MSANLITEIAQLLQIPEQLASSLAQFNEPTLRAAIQKYKKWISNNSVINPYGYFKAICTNNPKVERKEGLPTSNIDVNKILANHNLKGISPYYIWNAIKAK